MLVGGCGRLWGLSETRGAQANRGLGRIAAAALPGKARLTASSARQ